MLGLGSAGGFTGGAGKCLVSAQGASSTGMGSTVFTINVVLMVVQRCWWRGALSGGGGFFSLLCVLFYFC